MYVSEIMGLGIPSHKDLDFVNVDIENDTELFIDPCLILFGKDKYSKSAQKTIDSYFDRFYALYRNHRPKQELLELFEHVHEINKTKMGYGNGRNGKAKTPEGMCYTFQCVREYMDKKLDFSSPVDLVIVVKDFAEDCMSDILTNIIFDVLADFTLEQCKKYGVETTMVKYHYWSNTTNSWEEMKKPLLKADGEAILLVPKWFVRHRFFFGVSQYYNRVILQRMKEDSAYRDTNGKVKTTPKKQIDKNYRKDGESELECAIRSTQNDVSYLTDYHNMLPALYSDKVMTDEDLDQLVY